MRVQFSRATFSRATFSRAELATGDSEQLRCSTLDPCHFRESGQSFSYGFGLCLLLLCARTEGFLLFLLCFCKLISMLNYLEMINKHKIEMGTTNSK